MPVVVGIFGAQALAWVLVLGGLLALALAVGIVVQRIIARRFPVTSFDLDDVSEPAAQIESAKARLARGDYAAFTVNAVRNEDEPEASGQIWFYAAKTGGIEKTSIELSYEWPTEPGEQPALMGLMSGGWEITGREPDHWVLLSRQCDIDSSEAIRLVVAALGTLFQLEASTKWTFRAFA